MGGLPFPPKNCSAVDPLSHRMHYSMLTVKHEAVELVVKLEELVLHVRGVLKSEYQFLLPRIQSDFVCL